MTTLAKAPLIEVIFELRWGAYPELTHQQQFIVQDNNAETNLFPGLFMSRAKELGFAFHENANPHIPDNASIPQIVRHRFRKSEGSWPCYQIGLGIFTANQVNDGYQWKVFKSDVLNGLKILDESHPQHLAGLPNLSFGLRYQDGFLFGENESSLSFVTEKMAMNFNLPSKFLTNPLLKVDSSAQCQIGFDLALTEPRARIVCGMAPGFINGRKGFIMDTLVQSQNDAVPTATSKALSEWLDEAHVVHQHVFKAMIDPVYARTFK